jgi:hypothetical protein
MHNGLSTFCVVTVYVFLAVLPASAADWFVAPGGTGPGTSGAPFGRIQDGLNAAQAGDVVTVAAGVYTESIRTVRSGSAGARIHVRAQGPRGTVVVTAPANVLRVDHAYITVEGLVLDGQYAAADTVDVNSTAHFLTLRNLEVRRSTRDLIDIGNPQGVLIEQCLIHHALNAAGGRTDAHGVVASAVRNLTIRDTDIHTFSGDGLQVDPGRLAPGWSDVTVERTRIWLEPLPTPQNGFAAGAVPGENAIDTKAASNLPRAVMAIRDVTAWGFRGGLIGNMAAFNLKENVAVDVEGVTVYDSEIAFRLRGPGSALAGGAWVSIKNAVVYDTDYGFRYEDNIANLKVWNSTVGRGVTRPFRAASSGSAGVEVRNLLVLGPLPPEASHASNSSAGPEAFVNASADNYALAPGAAAIDAGIALPGVTTDRIGAPRPQGDAYDVGAYEAPATVTTGSEVVVYASNAQIVNENWRRVVDTSAAGGAALWDPNVATPRIAASTNPTHYFEITAYVEQGRKYRLWLRGRADQDSPENDAVWVQFSGSINSKGQPVYRIGTASAAPVTLKDCQGCVLSGWGWQDNRTGESPGVLGPLIRFETTGLQTIRVQTREDGLRIDQIVLSSALYLNAAPGAARNDNTILMATQ